MILIIDSYKHPSKIVETKFKLKNAIELTESTVRTKDFQSYVYFVHKECVTNLSLVKYYFNEIYELNENIYYINKKKNICKIYDYNFNDLKNKANNNKNDVKNDMKNVKKEDYLPYYDVQNDQVVEFPDEDGEEL